MVYGLIEGWCGLGWLGSTQNLQNEKQNLHFSFLPCASSCKSFLFPALFLLLLPCPHDATNFPECPTLFLKGDLIPSHRKYSKKDGGCCPLVPNISKHCVQTPSLLPSPPPPVRAKKPTNTEKRDTFWSALALRQQDGIHCRTPPWAKWRNKTPSSSTCLLMKMQKKQPSSLKYPYSGSP